MDQYTAYDVNGQQIAQYTHNCGAGSGGMSRMYAWIIKLHPSTVKITVDLYGTY